MVKRLRFSGSNLSLRKRARSSIWADDRGQRLHSPGSTLSLHTATTLPSERSNYSETDHAQLAQRCIEPRCIALKWNRNLPISCGSLRLLTFGLGGAKFAKFSISMSTNCVALAWA